MSTTVSQRRTFIERGHASISISKQCTLLSINRSGLYYKMKKLPEHDLEIMKAIDKIHLKDATIGTRRMKYELKNEGFKIGRKKIRRLMYLMRIKTVYCKPRTTIPDPAKYKHPYLLRNLKIRSPNHVWAIDISYIPMNKGFMYLVAVIDLFSRYIVGWDISNSMEASWVVETLKQTFDENGIPEILNSDQGSQFTSEEYTGELKQKNIAISMDGKGRATDNAFIERFFRTIKYEKLYLEPSENGADLYEKCKQFIDYYNNQRLHSSLGYIPPMKHYRKAA